MLMYILHQVVTRLLCGLVCCAHPAVAGLQSTVTTNPIGCDLFNKPCLNQLVLTDRPGNHSWQVQNHIISWLNTLGANSEPQFCSFKELNGPQKIFLAWVLFKG